MIVDRNAVRCNGCEMRATTAEYARQQLSTPRTARCDQPGRSAAGGGTRWWPHPLCGSAATSRMFRGALGPYRVTYQALLSSDDADRCNVLAFQVVTPQTR